MENYAELGKDRLLNIKCRVNQPSVPRVLRFVNSDGTAHAITDYAFRIPVWKVPNATNPIFTLTIGDGLTVQGDDDNELLIEVSEDRATVRPDVYFWLLEGLEDSEYQAWLNGDWQFYIGKYDGVEQTEEITINTAEAVVTITLELAGNDPNAIHDNVSGEIDDITEKTAPIGDDLFLIEDSAASNAKKKAKLRNLGAIDTRTVSTASTATLTPNLALYDLFLITAQAEALVIANPSGAVQGNGFMVDVTDNGTARAITYGDKYRAYAIALPPTTILGKGIKLVFQYDSVDDKHDLLNVINQL